MNAYMGWSVKTDKTMKRRFKNIFIGVSLLCFFICSAFFFPRWLVSVFGLKHFLSSYLYIYGSGIPFFILGIWLLLRSKALDLRIAGEKKWLVFFILGISWSVLAHGVWILMAVQIPFFG